MSQGNEIITTQQNRTFVQYGRARPSNPTLFYGLGTNYAVIQGVTFPVNGAVTPHWAGDPRVPGKYRLVARTIAAPPIPAATMHLWEKKGTLNKMLAEDCGFTAYILTGDCDDLSDLIAGWRNGRLEVYADAIIGSINGGNRGAFADDAPLEDQVPITPREIYQVGAMGFGRVADADIAVEMLDGCYANLQRCGSCGKANNGVIWQYLIQKHSGSNAAGVLYTTDGWQTSNFVDIGILGATVDPTGIEVVGEFLVVLAGTENAYYYARINQATGAPGTFSKVTDGFVVAKTPTDITVGITGEAFISALGGYVYKLSRVGGAVVPVASGSPTTADLARIANNDQTLVAVGATGEVIISSNYGQSWAVAVSAPSGANLLTVDVRDANRYWVGDDDGGLYSTEDGGNTWDTATLGDTVTAIDDVVFVNDEIGWAVGEDTDSTQGLIFWTPNGGRDWSADNAAPRMFGIPATGFQRANRIAVPKVGNPNIAANYATVVGLGATTDGVVLFGAPNFF